MKIIPTVLLMLAAYAATSNPPTSPGGPDTPEPPGDATAPAAKVTVRFAFTQLPERDETPRTEIAVVVSDPAAADIRRAVGQFDGGCRDSTGFDLPETPDPGKPFMAATCFFAGAGVRLQVAQEGRFLVVTRSWYEEQSDPTPFEEIARLELRPGVVATRAPDSGGRE